ncbi:Response regulator receiver domain-containing protein [Candidatus Kryptonium thompsonii]|jgi:DNA-binding response OmpR family regulator|uniref:Response regulator receiver domain-containing protein n=1 Tax=Candidatus Kryptonium thompsonii TaxID=1633631 RepID=A0ABM9UUG7_9BACT|nr:response regulator [Candidatus Kryptonium thompsoni]CUS77890.1 Response regulator receiver domain-containing protein [Candidatus Kryptonium thompsoni]CUS79161.1 Response regulator receiver domain-containing protein [Candidatus Kryptonium thompsoni]CUS81749.1 Response regulator receiver domain-containing protein [Candidatus Kryptonium thompsoni]CUS83829.1 Response regulator receiver domain-containing protein [Candidatus Kryptonium thompsoni]CUS84851.1 Response regulator receiver domain-conta
MLKKILIVDDDITVQRLLEFILRKFSDVDVFIASDGDMALDIIRKEKPNLIFLDFMMPGKNGIEVCREVKNDPELKNSYIVMLTAKGEEADVKDMFEAGADEYVPKPFTPSEIAEIVRKIIYKEQ